MTVSFDREMERAVTEEIKSSKESRMGREKLKDEEEEEELPRAHSRVAINSQSETREKALKEYEANEVEEEDDGATVKSN